MKKLLTAMLASFCLLTACGGPDTYESSEDNIRFRTKVQTEELSKLDAVSRDATNQNFKIRGNDDAEELDCHVHGSWLKCFPEGWPQICAAAGWETHHDGSCCIHIGDQTPSDDLTLGGG